MIKFNKNFLFPYQLSLFYLNLIIFDESDKLALRGAIARPKLRLALNKILQLSPDKHERLWYDCSNRTVLKSEIWGQWRVDLYSYGRNNSDTHHVIGQLQPLTATKHQKGGGCL